MSDAISTSRPSSSTSHHPAETSSVHSHGTSSPALLTPIGTPPCANPGVLGASHGSSSGVGVGGHPSHAHPHHFSGGRWNPFSEAKLQALLSPFDAGSGWRDAHHQAGEGDMEGMMRKTSLGEGQQASTRFEKRALSQGAGVGAGRSGLSMTAFPSKGEAEGKKVEVTKEASTSGDADATGAGKNMARRQSMPEGHNQQVPLRRPSLSFLSNLSMSRPASFTPSSTGLGPLSPANAPPSSSSHTHHSALAGGSAISESPAPSTHVSPAIRPSSAASHASFGSEMKPLSEIPREDLGAPALGGIPPPPHAGVMQRSKTMPMPAGPKDVKEADVRIERRHFDPCREPKLLHFM